MQCIAINRIMFHKIKQVFVTTLLPLIVDLQVFFNRLKDNKPLEGNTNYTISCSGDVFKLQGKIKDAEDGGVIICKAKNKAGEDSRKANLKVNGKCFFFYLLFQVSCMLVLFL